MIKFKPWMEVKMGKAWKIIGHLFKHEFQTFLQFFGNVNFFSVIFEHKAASPISGMPRVASEVLTTAEGEVWMMKLPGKQSSCHVLWIFLENQLRFLKWFSAIQNMFDVWSWKLLLLLIHLSPFFLARQIVYKSYACIKQAEIVYQHMTSM